MGQRRDRLGHRLAVRRDPDDATLPRATDRLGLAHSLRLRSPGWPRRALHPLAHRRNARLSQGGKATEGVDHRSVAPPPGSATARIRLHDCRGQLLLSAPLYPDLRDQDTAPACLYGLSRNAGGRDYSRDLLGRRRAPLGQDRATHTDYGDNGLAVASG